MITIAQRAKVIGVCTAVNLFFELVGTLYSCVGHYVVEVVAMDDASMFQYYFQHFYESKHPWHACNNGAIEREMCINLAQLYLRDG